MNFDAFDAVGSDLFTMVRAMINKTILVSYGKIEKVNDDGTVVVIFMYKEAGNVVRAACRYLTFSSALAGISCPPQEGDKVLLLSTQHMEESVLASDVPISVSRKTGYGFQSLVAVPLGIFNEASSFTVKVDKDTEKTTIKSDYDLAVDAPMILLGGDTDTLAKFQGLNTALQTLISTLNSQLSSIQTAAAAAAAAGGHWLTPLTIGGLSLDLSAAEATKVKTGD